MNELIRKDLEVTYATADDVKAAEEGGLSGGIYGHQRSDWLNLGIAKDYIQAQEDREDFILTGAGSDEIQQVTKAGLFFNKQTGRALTRYKDMC